MKADPKVQNLLIELQKIDIQVTQAKAKLANLPEHEQIKAVQARLADGAVELKVVETELEDVSIDLRRSELEVEQVADRINKDEKRLSSGQGSPKELEQTQHEIVSLNKRKSELEELELEIMVRHEAVTKRLDELKNDEIGLHKIELELNIRVENAKAETAATLEQLQGERAALLPKIDAPLIDLYEKIRVNGAGVGAALLVGNKCDGCHLEINTTELMRIKELEADEVLRCEECRRILVRI